MSPSILSLELVTKGYIKVGEVSLPYLQWIRLRIGRTCECNAAFKRLYHPNVNPYYHLTGVCVFLLRCSGGGGRVGASRGPGRARGRARRRPGRAGGSLAVQGLPVAGAGAGTGHGPGGEVERPRPRRAVRRGAGGGPGQRGQLATGPRAGDAHRRLAGWCHPPAPRSYAQSKANNKTGSVPFSDANLIGGHSIAPKTTCANAASASLYQPNEKSRKRQSS